MEARLVAAGILLLPALAAAVMAPILTQGRRALFPDTPVLRWLPHPTWLIATHYLVEAGFELLPPGLRRLRPLGVRLGEVVSLGALVVTMPAVRQLITLVTSPGWGPGRAWLVRNYGPAVVLCAVGLPIVLSPPTPAALAALRSVPAAVVLYMIVMALVTLVPLRQRAQPGGWRAGGSGGPRQRDVALYTAGLLMLAACAAILSTGRVSWLLVVLHAAIGLTFLVPTMAVTLGMAIRGVCFVLAMIGATAAIYLGAEAIAARVDPVLRPVADFAAVVALLGVLVPGQVWIRVAIDRLVFRRAGGRGEELQTFVQTLSPERGVADLCARALERLVATMRLRAAAVVLVDGAAVAAGPFPLEPVRAVWPRGPAADALPARLVPAQFGVLPPALRIALVEADVLGMVEVRSPRRRWGHLLNSTTPLAAIFTHDDVRAVLAFADQLALVLDAADLLARAVAVERSLAHAEKLAAIGETAARIAHEIRNPVTAARSLAQQLAREPGAPYAAELELILGELERVERQVAALLRFARREELRLEAVDLAQLVRGTLDALAARLAEARVEVDLELADGCVARGDREKLRQVLVNVVENAVDALGAVPGPRRLAVAVAQDDGVATLRVSDNGPGAPPDALARLFEPFFSLKEAGTGLGLAIARRTVEAHGGRIAVGPGAAGGLAFSIALPRAEGA